MNSKITGSLLSELNVRFPAAFDEDLYFTVYHAVKTKEMEECIIPTLIELMNKYFATVNNPDNILQFTYSSGTDVPTNVEIKSDAYMKKFFKKYTLNRGDKDKTIFDIWGADRRRHRYNDVVFDPTQKNDTKVFNFFNGLRAECECRQRGLTAYDPSKFDKIMDLILNLCGNDAHAREWFLDVIAWSIQYKSKPGVSIVIESPQGCGKGMIFNDLLGKRIYGDSAYAPCPGGTDLFSNFNAPYDNKLFIYVDEFQDLSKHHQGFLKYKITEDSTRITRKYMDSVIKKDYVFYAFTGNKIPDNMVDADDRRYLMLKASNDKDKEFFTQVAYQIAGTHDYRPDDDNIGEGALHFYLFLMQRDIVHFKYGQRPPMTSFKRKVTEMNVDPVFRYIQHLVENDDLPNKTQRHAEFYKSCLAWCREEGIRPAWKDCLTMMRAIECKLTLKRRCGEDTPVVTNEKVKLKIDDPRYDQSQPTRNTVREGIKFPSAEDLKRIMRKNHVWCLRDEDEDTHENAKRHRT